MRTNIARGPAAMVLGETGRSDAKCTNNRLRAVVAAVQCDFKFGDDGCGSLSSELRSIAKNVRALWHFTLFRGAMPPTSAHSSAYL